MSRVLFNGLQKKAQQALQEHFVPPKRYGTAFHITPSVTDIREMPTIHEQSFFASTENGGPSLTSDQQEKITALTMTDPYLLWLLSSVPAAQWRIFTVASGHQMHLRERAQTHALWFLFLEAGSELTIEHFLTESDIALQRIYVWQASESHFSLTAVRGRNNFLNEHIEIVLEGTKAHATTKHFTLGSNKGQSDISVRVRHNAPATTSRVDVRTAAADMSVNIFRGLLTITREAPESSGFQKCEGLSLSPRAIIDALPELAIHTNAVRCSHGVTTTHLDDESLFYVRSRGLEVAQAKQLALHGFYEHDLTLSPTIREALGQLVYD